uniref:hypothetical protein n=1 Tax=Pedobacter schmidteae TaxID=2201271 RepID=UPI000EB1303D|nr:hypothetical protein [Pedobacter schmidteae]
MSSITFVIITLLSLLLFYFGTGKDKRVLVLIIFWQFLIGVFAMFGIFQTKPILFPLVIIGTILLTIFLIKKIATQKINTNILLSIHILRIIVELILYQLFLQNKIPKLMTFNGWNYDILIGISALAILTYQLVSKRNISRQIFIIWNIAGIVFLMFIVSLAILSSPLPIQQFAFEQPNIGILEFPYCFLPTCIVPIVLISHIFLIIKLKYE